MSSSFDRVQAILAGTTRISLDHLGTKVLHFMLKRNEGCNATVTPDRFYVQFGWHPSRHRYVHEIAPRVVSWLCDAAPTSYLAGGALPGWFEVTDTTRIESFTSVRGGAMVRHSEPPGPYWTYGPRRIWFDRSPERVVIMIRDATIDPGAESLPPPIEPPIEYLAGDHLCPHCGAVPERYRKLRDGGLVCLACGASSG